MILTCPECTKQFKVPSDKIGPEGRMVRCQSCKTKWFVDAPDFADVLNETSGDAGKDVSAAIDSFREAEEEERLRAEAERRAREEMAEERAKARAEARAAQGHVPKERKLHVEGTDKGQNTVLSVCAGIIGFLLLVMLSLPFHQALSTAWPPLNSLYSVIGFPMEVPGEGLVFDSVVVDQDGKTVKLDGRIINLTPKLSDIPSIALILLPTEDDAHAEVEDGEVKPLAEPIHFTLPEKEINGESELTFTHVEPLPKDWAQKDFQVKLEFLPVID
ncbi:MAG: zinc-ribbon domain-containing protein [Pseudobdellovibrionaceae bacterium]